MTAAGQAKRYARQGGWSVPRSATDQSAGHLMPLRAGESEVAVLAQPKKRPSEAVARAAGVHPRERVNEGKRDS
jgi:hypothetical protein